jgi:aspartate aminotransferase
MFEEGAELKARHGAENVFDLSLGNPVMEPPPEFHEELRRLAENPLPGMHRYMANAGYAETRAAVAARLSRETKINFTSSDIVMTCGAAGALNVVLKAILNPGDGVVLLAPYFPEYANYIDNHGGIARVVATDEGFLPRFDVLEDGIGAKTRAVVINFPNNPTGVVYGDKVIRKLGQLLSRKSTECGREIFLISDEPYRRLVYDGLVCPHVWTHYQSSIVVSSHSKDLAIPGERIGYIAVHPATSQREELINGLIYCNRTLGYVNASALMQRVVTGLQSVTVPIEEYQRKRDFLYQHLTSFGYSVVKPRGAFYMFPKSPAEDDVTFVKELQQHLVLAVPGCGFGTPGYFRLSYCVSDRTLAGSLDGFRQVAQKYELY